GSSPPRLPDCSRPFSRRTRRLRARGPVLTRSGLARKQFSRPGLGARPWLPQVLTRWTCRSSARCKTSGRQSVLEPCAFVPLINPLGVANPGRVLCLKEFQIQLESLLGDSLEFVPGFADGFLGEHRTQVVIQLASLRTFGGVLQVILCNTRIGVKNFFGQRPV